ncbi:MULTISPECIES: ScbR family autoregulator-binding transcription factor [Streptomyces]|uniref:ScbR family autoregulator-binding transcription factor n=1 Tax=Streptomyces TaxID=1883 RepID=UPI0006E1643E|nr:ScbR family autoregulator-binding transcription factor [Streptomyces prasinus]
MVKQERAAHTRRALVRAAGEEFAHGGYKPVSLSRISKRAGVSYGGLHYHFAGKEDLARAVVAEAAAILRDEVCAATGSAPGDGGRGALARLVESTYRLVDRIDRDAVVRAGFTLTLAASSPDLGEDLCERWRCWVEEILAEAARAQELGAGIRGADVATAVVATTVGFEALSVRDPAWLKPDAVARFWRLILPGITSPETAAALHADRRPPRHRGTAVQRLTPSR